MKKLLSLAFVFLIVSVSDVYSQTESEAMTKQLQRMLKSKFPNAGPESREFIYDMVDLNDDGKSEVLLYLLGPDNCGSGGCTMYVLGPTLKTITRMTVVGTPVMVGPPASKERSKGYSHIYVYSKGKGNVKMVWNGKTYPSNPSMQPAVPESVTADKYKFLDESKKSRYKF